MTKSPCCGADTYGVREKLFCSWCQRIVEGCCEGGQPNLSGLQPTTVYVGGPMRGKEWFGFPAFDTARDYLASHGIAVLSPADHDRECGFEPAKLGEQWDWNTVPLGFDLGAALVWCADAVRKADAVLLLSGWESSRGARWELELALMLNKPVMFKAEDVVTFARGR